VQKVLFFVLFKAQNKNRKNIGQYYPPILKDHRLIQLIHLGKGLLGKLKGKAEGFSKMITQKSGVVSNGLGSLIGKTMDGGTGLVGGIGKQLGQLASKGPEALKSLTGGMQNMLPSSLGGELAGIGNKLQGMTKNCNYYKLLLLKNFNKMSK
jgi:hypothetical protein